MTMIIDGTNGLTFNNSTTQASAGKVLQVVNATSNSNITTTSTSFVSTNFSISITPKFSTSKILLLVNGGSGYVSASSVSMWCTIYRNSTNIGDATNGLERFFATNTAFLAPHSMCVFDSPATTSSTTYTCYFKSSSSTAVDFLVSDRGTLSFTALEIAT
jgi:hypothetical protein